MSKSNECDCDDAVDTAESLSWETCKYYVHTKNYRLRLNTELLGGGEEAGTADVEEVRAILKGNGTS